MHMHMRTLADVESALTPSVCVGVCCVGGVCVWCISSRTTHNQYAYTYTYMNTDLKSRKTTR
jgi:hypothetical protein